MDAIGYVNRSHTAEIMEPRPIPRSTCTPTSAALLRPLRADSLQIDGRNIDRRVVERCAMMLRGGDRARLVLEMWSRVKVTISTPEHRAAHLRRFGLLFIWLVYARYESTSRNAVSAEAEKGMSNTLFT